MADDRLKIEVSVGLMVSDEIADRCLVLLEWWQYDHNEQWLMATTNADGSIHLYRELKHDLGANMRGVDDETATL